MGLKKRKRVYLRELLDRCTDDNREMFRRMYPMGLAKMSRPQVTRAIHQTEWTIFKNWRKTETHKLFQLNL